MFTSVHRPDDVRVFHREARSLADAGYEVILLAHADFASDKRQGVLIYGLKKPHGRWQRLLSGWRFFLHCRNIKADVYHFHDFELLPVGWLLKKTNAGHVVYDCHENHPETVLERAWLPDWIKPALSRLVAWIEPAMARSLDAVICVVPDQQNRLTQKGCKTILVRNYPRLEDMPSPPDEEKAQEIIYLGGLSIARGALVLVDIMCELRVSHPLVRLICLGPFNEPRVEEKVRQYARDRKVDALIDFLPLTPHEAVFDFLYRARVGLIPWQPVPQMLKMCYPNKIFEYMACGLPIVSSDLPGLRQLITPSGCGLLVDPSDARGHAKAIAHLLKHPAKAEQMGALGRDYVHKQYTWHQESQVLLRLYQSFSE
jgi:glycosyltransferase involved in cell wall biosynthesis